VTNIEIAKGGSDMKKLATGLLALWLGASVSGRVLADEAHEKGEKVSMADLPAPVKATFDKQAKGGEVEEVYKDTKNGKTVYRGEIVKNGKGTDLEVSESGKILHRGKPHDESKEKGEHNQ
jgi:hypothetical protein